MTTRDELLSRFNEGIERRAVGIASISRYFDSVIAPIEKLMTTHLWTDYEVNFSVAGDALDLLKFFRIMRANGFVPDNRPDDNKPSFNTYFRHPDGTVFYLSFSSTVCRRVQVRTEMVETPIYEIRCGGETVPPTTDTPIEMVVAAQPPLSTTTTEYTDDIPL